MNNELLIWAMVLVILVGGVTLFFWGRRARQRARWRSKRPIHVKVQAPVERD